MKRMIWTIAALAVTLTALASPALRTAGAAEPPSKFKVGDKAPDFTLQDIGGRAVQLSRVTKDRVVLLAFWSLRCGACLQEVPSLEKIHNSYRGKAVAVLSVVTDGVDAATTKSVMKEVGVAPTYPVLTDPDFAVSDQYTNFVVPHTLIIDRKGIVRYVHTGFDRGDEKKYEAALAAALGP